MVQKKEFEGLLVLKNKYDIEILVGEDKYIVKNSKYSKEGFNFDDLVQNKLYRFYINENNGILYLYNAEPITKIEKKEEFKSGDEIDKFSEIIKSNNVLDVKQLLIMAQSCQHDAVELISKKGYSDEEAVSRVIRIRDSLLRDIVEKYWK